MAVTLKQIAERCGLSIQTVSHVFNGRAHLFRPATRDLVLKTARELGYRPNGAAKAMQSGRYNCAALVLSTQPGRSSVFPPMLAGIDDELARHGMHLVHAPLADERLSDTGFVPKILSEWLADGLLINYNAAIPAALVEAIAQHRIPSIWINSQQPYDCVHPDDFGAGRMACEHLLSLGHRRIAYVDYAHGSAQPPNHYSAHDRQAGYEHALIAAGLQPQIFQGSETFVSSELLPAILAWLGRDDRPSAIVTYSPRDALPVLYAASALLSLNVPRDLAIVTIDDDPADQLGVAITTVILPRYELGRVSAELLVARIFDPNGQSQPRILPCRLHLGQTSALT